MRLSSYSRFRRAAFGLVFPICLGALAGAAGCSRPTPIEAAAVVEDLSPIPAPEGHLADLFLPAPDATWSKARALVGGPAAFFPQSFGALAATALKLPVAVAAEIDGAVPVIGAALKKGAAPPQVAVGIHVKAGGRFLDQLTKGPEARFTARLDEASRITLVMSTSDTPGADPGVVMGVLGNYLLIAPHAADLTAAGPYVVRTLSSRPAPNEDLVIEMPEAALSGPVLAEAQRSWANTRRDLEKLGTPSLQVTATVDSLLGVLGDSKQGRLTLELEAAAVHARLTMTPKSGEGAASRAFADMAVGDLAPLLDLPGRSLVGVQWREPATVRAAAIPAQAEAIARLLGAAAKAEDKEAILAALRAEDAVRGDWVAFGLSLDPTGPNAMVRAPLLDADRMSAALKQLLALGKLASVKAQIKEAALDVTTGKTVIENLPGDVQRVRFERRPAKDAKSKAASPAQEGGIPTSIDLLYLVTKDALFGAAGYDPKEALRSLVNAPSGTSLGANPAIKAAVGGLGAEASFALVVDPLRLLAARAGKSAPAESAPVVVAIGKTAAPNVMWGRIDVAAIVVQELVKHRGDLF
jgi:hypothetical protein